MTKKPILADVARAAGVSMMTVSRAINNKPGVSDKVRQEIQTLAAEMGFQPNQIARSLVTHQSATIGLVVPDITNPFFAQIARGVEDLAYEAGYSLFLLNSAENLKREAVAFNSLQQKEIDGAILCSSRHRESDLRVQAQRFPAVVLVNRELKDPLPNVVTINVNDQRGAQLATQHFLEQNRAQIACISGPANSVSAQRRLQGYRACLKDAGRPFDPRLVEPCVPTIEGGQAAAAALLARCPGLDAVLAFNDLAAIGAMLACQDAGKGVPRDVAVIGADNIFLAGLVRPRLSTLNVNLGHIGRLAMRSLLDIIQGTGAPAAIQIEPELILRDSA